jgi:dienelactone hydrolase
MTANLYLPENPAGRMPGMVIVHSQHYPKTQGELHDMGEMWARAGVAVLVMERPGYGERVQTTPWYRQAYGSRFLFSKQLFLTGESYSGWAAWDIIRSVDYLLERSDIDRERIIVLGSVAGGGEPAGVAAALDPRITAVAPFNYDQGHVRVHGDSPGQIGKQFSPWVVAASIAPRKFIRAFEFGWEGAEKADYPDLWFDGLERSRKVWGFYDALDNLATSQAYGLIRLSMERVSHCFSIGPQQRAELHPTLQRWFGIPLPSDEDLAILPDSQLSTNPQREAARLQEAGRRRPHAELLSMTPEVSLQIQRDPLHQIARDIAAEDLAAARKRRNALKTEAQADDLRKKLEAKLGEISPNPRPDAVMHGRRSVLGADVEAISLTVEEGISVPLLLLLPKQRAAGAVAVAVAQGGKERFLANRAKDIAALLEQGIAVCLPDVRATGETSPSSERRDNGAHQGLAQLEFDLGRSLLGSQLRDLRTVLAYLRSRSDLGLKKIALWGDSFVPANPEHLYLDEIEAHSGPQIQYQAEPMGAHLALLAALYENDVQAIVARGGLDAYLSALDSPFTYTPVDTVVVGILKSGDVSDIAAALAPRPLRLESLVDGRNVLATQAEIEHEFALASNRYKQQKAGGSLVLSQERGDVAAWLPAQLN